MKWGYGCQVGVYAQHVYTTLPENQTVDDYLHYQAAAGTTIQQVKDVAGSLLFTGELIEKKIKVLSGGERARLVLAGLLLQQHNVLILDEPGNHLDVESVEALADALCRYQGTVLFTSHDRHFMHRVATAVVEVRDGAVKSYPASYDDYVYRTRKELEAGLRAEHTTRGLPDGGASTGTAPRKVGGREERELQKKQKAVERKIAKLDEEKKAINDSLLTATDAKDAKKLHDQLTTIASEVEQLEEEWLEIYNELEGVE